MKQLLTALLITLAASAASAKSDTYWLKSVSIEDLKIKANDLPGYVAWHYYHHGIPDNSYAEQKKDSWRAEKMHWLINVMGACEAYYQYTHELYSNIAFQQQETETYTEELGWHYPNEEINENWERIDYEHNEYGDSLCIHDYTLSDEWLEFENPGNQQGPLDAFVTEAFNDQVISSATKFSIKILNGRMQWLADSHELVIEGDYRGGTKIHSLANTNWCQSGFEETINETNNKITGIEEERNVSKILLIEEADISSSPTITVEIPECEDDGSAWGLSHNWHCYTGTYKVTVQF